MEDLSHLAPTKRSGIKSLYTAFQILSENGNEMSRKDLIDELTKRITFEDWELERYRSNNQLKWLTIFLFYTVDCIKAGWLAKNKGIWYLTPEGKEAINLGPQGLFEQAGKAYREWKSNQSTTDTPIIPPPSEEDINIADQQVQKVTLEEMDAQAKEGIGRFLEVMDEYKFQQLSAVLLKSMGYHVDFIAPPGKDGGIDIIAYKDPLGFSKPRIKVQVKRYNEKNKADIDDIRILKSLLHAGEDIGVFITSGYFTRDAEKFARESNIHIKLINRISFIELWSEYYPTLDEEERTMLPLQPIYFLGSNE